MKLSTKFLTAPNVVFWDVTYACNMRCSHCFSSAGKASTNELTTDEALDLIDELAKIKVFWIGFGGGEPLLRNDFLKLLEYATEKKIQVTFSTNGFLIDECYAQELSKLGISYVQVSIDGCEHTHDALRGVKGSFRKAIECVRKLSNVGIRTIIATVVHRKNFEELDQIFSLALNLEVYGWRILRFIPLGRGDKNWVLSLNQCKHLALLLRNYEALASKKIRLLSDESYRLFANRTQKGEQLLPIQNLPRCPAAQSVCAITPEGYVLPCNFFESPNLMNALNPENIRQRRFREIWRNSPLLTRFRTGFDITGQCSLCRHFDSCGGGCRAAAFAAERDFRASDPLCLLFEQREN
jgi:mycofactocin radical SAM maturase